MMHGIVVPHTVEGSYHFEGETAHPAMIASQMIDSDQMQSQWEVRHKSRADENPAHARHDEITQMLSGHDDWKPVLAENPEHLKFMQEFIALQRGALHSRIHPFAVSKDLRDVKKGLDIIAAELADILPEEELPRVKDLPDDMQEILNMEKFHTAQKPFQPVRGAASYLWSFLKHLDHEVWEHRHSVAPAAAIMGYVTYMMVSTLGVSSTALSQEDVTMHVCGIEDAIAGRSGAQCESTTPVSLPEVFQNCHSHLAPLVFNYEPAVNLLVDMGAAKVLGPDCSKVSTLGDEARSVLMKGYDANLNRHQETIGNPVEHLLETIENIGLSAAPDPEVAQREYREQLNRTIDETVEGINAYDVYENLILHGGIVGLVGMLMTSAIARGKRPTSQGLKSTGTRFGNFFNRLARNSPLTTLGAAAGAAQPAMTNYFWQGDVFTGNLNPDVVLYGLAGGIAGSAIEKTVRYARRRTHMRQMSVDVKDQLTALASSHSLSVDAPKIDKKSLMKPAVITAFAGAAGYGLVNLDFMLDNGQLTAQIMGTATPVALFMASNPITDVIAHKGFAAAGAVFGLVAGVGLRSAYVVGNNVLRPSKKVSFFKSYDEEEGHDDHHHHHDHDHDDDEDGLVKAIFGPLVSAKNWNEAFPIDPDSYHAREIYRQVEERYAAEEPEQSLAL